MTPLKLALITLFSAAVLPACATVNKGTSDFFRIDSVPQGAIATTTIETDESVKARRKNPQLEPEYIGCSPTPCAIRQIWPPQQRQPPEPWRREPQLARASQQP